ncbi:MULTISPECIES: tail completion protein gp17 [unclassified Gilliamella]|uniref:tail completion protein gp17 n=1 Tax=unclassified Gilliamella TaxID=2685620 RepID=UPI00132572B2|nr:MULTISPECIES: DUF3168 domain-containing protein [unclassified Gilliamella]MWN32094.1 DUF3168 domain-containing protein [Gilliamella sp. Pra-s60]MWP29353.1 DUF3168 domain-containing protein [Gilliamella sp. Pra-s54]
MIEIKINNTLKTLCDGRVSPLVAPQGTSPPYICYTKISEVYDDVMCGQSFVEYCFQIDIYAKTLLEAENIRAQAYEKLKLLKPFNITSRQGYETETELYRSTLEFYIQ